MANDSLSRLHLAFCLGLLILLPSGAAEGAPASRITKSQLRSDPPNVTDRRLKDVIWSLFEKQDHRRDKAPTRQLTSLHLRTKVQATRVPDLCRYDSVRVEFERVNERDEGADAPVRPVGLTSTSYFTFLSVPAAEYGDIRRNRPASPSRCSNLSDDHTFFSAGDEEMATNGYRAWLALLEAIRGGRKFPLECNLTRVDTVPCEAVIAALKPEQLYDVETCEGETGFICHLLYVDDRLIKVLTTGHVSPGPPAGLLVSAKLDSLIIMSHEIID